jgi:hypothetical protein
VANALKPCQGGFAPRFSRLDFKERNFKGAEISQMESRDDCYTIVKYARRHPDIQISIFKEILDGIYRE